MSDDLQPGDRVEYRWRDPSKDRYRDEPSYPGGWRPGPSIQPSIWWRFEGYDDDGTPLCRLVTFGRAHQLPSRFPVEDLELRRVRLLERETR